MEADRHGNGHGLDDLYLLPETKEEEVTITTYLDAIGRNYEMQRSDVDGQEWYRKRFIEVPFGESLLPEIVALID